MKRRGERLACWTRKWAKPGGGQEAGTTPWAGSRFCHLAVASLVPTVESRALLLPGLGPRLALWPLANVSSASGVLEGGPLSL